MIKSGIDQEALIASFAQATAKQGDTLRTTVSEATLKALQGRELTLDNIRKVLKAVTQAASAGAAQNTAKAVDVEALMANAVAGMDAALLKAIEAQRKALQGFIDQDVLEQARTSAYAGNATGLKASKAMMDSYASLVSGVLAGMSEGLQPTAKASGSSARRR
jgi:hypothetical protein